MKHYDESSDVPDPKIVKQILNSAPEPLSVDDLVKELIQGIDDAYTALQDGDHQEYLEVKDQAEAEAKAQLTRLINEARISQTENIMGYASDITLRDYRGNESLILQVVTLKMLGKEVIRLRREALYSQEPSAQQRFGKHQSKGEKL